MSDQEKPSAEPKRAFLNRWSERKRLVKAEREANEAVEPIVENPDAFEENTVDDIESAGTLGSLNKEGKKSQPPLSDASTANALQSYESDSSESATVRQGVAHQPAQTLPAELSVADVQADTKHKVPAQELLLSDMDMLPIESLSAESDLSAFFNKGVSAALRKAALRHVFQLPKFNVRDGLNDYDGDYTVFEPLGDTVTSDMKWHIARKERARLEAEEKERLALEQLEHEEHERAQTEMENQEQRLQSDDEGGSANESETETLEDADDVESTEHESDQIPHLAHESEHTPLAHSVVDGAVDVVHTGYEKRSSTEQLQPVDPVVKSVDRPNKLRLIDLDTQQNKKQHKETDI